MFGEQQDIPITVLLSIQVPSQLPQIVFPTRGQQGGTVQISFKRKPLGLQRLTMIWAICVVEDVSVHLDLEFFATLERPPFFTWVSADTASAVCPAHPSNLAITSTICAAVFCETDDPCSVNTAYAPESSFTMSPRSTTRPLYFWYFCSNFAFLR